MVATVGLIGTTFISVTFVVVVAIPILPVIAAAAAPGIAVPVRHTSAVRILIIDQAVAVVVKTVVTILRDGMLVGLAVAVVVEAVTNLE